MKALLHQVIETIDGQAFLPRSPGVMVGDQALLCAGAAVVRQAAASTLCFSELRRLSTEMIWNGKEAIVQKAKEFSLDVNLVELIVLNNDACPDDERQERMTRFLRDLAAQMR